MDDTPLPEISSVDPSNDPPDDDYYEQFAPTEPKNEAAMYFANLENSMVLEERGATYRILKDGYEAFIAISHFEDDQIPLAPGKTYKNLKIKPTRSWILKKDKNGNPKLEWKVYEP